MSRNRLRFALGSAFSIPADVVWPVAVEQLVVALSVGSFLGLKAAADGRSAFLARAVGGATALAAVPPLAAAAAKDTPEAPVRVRLATTR